MCTHVDDVICDIIGDGAVSEAKLCVGRAQLVEVGQSTSLSLLLKIQKLNQLVLDKSSILDVTIY